MKLKEKINWRFELLKDLYKKKELKLSDIFFVFLPNNSLRIKKDNETIKKGIKHSPIKVKRFNFNLLSLEFYNFKIIVPKSIKYNTIVTIMDFGLPLLNIDDYNKFIFTRREGPYELKECKIQKGDFVIDAGANMGLFSILASDKVGGNGKIFAFEPIEKTNNIFAKNLKINNVKNCKNYKYALGNAKKKIPFFISNNKLDAASMFKNKKIAKKELIEQIRLDDFIKDNNIEKVDFIKADIEGAERYFLEGAKETIKRFKPKISICTYHFEDDKEVLSKFLKDNVPEYKIEYKYKKLYACTDN
ncbi:MAG: FkbM family methyltransferase [Parcubacteria group bacterium]